MMKSLDPEMIVLFDGRLAPLREAKVSILTHALHYGTGVFEGIRGYWDPSIREMFLLRPLEHFVRWKKNGGILRIHVEPTADQLVAMTAEMIRRNRFECNVYVRPLAYKSAERIGIYTDAQDSFSMVGFPVGDYLDSTKGLHAGISSWRRLEDNAIPGRAKICGAYVNSALASDDARRCGFDEAIFLNEHGHVAEGSSSNIFIVRDRKLITPPPSENILEGITRDCVMQLARRELRLEVVERPVDRSELYVADEAFFTGTAVEVAPIISVDHRPVGAGQIGPLTLELRRLYMEATRGRLDAYCHWLTPVYNGGREPAMSLPGEDSLWGV